MAKEVLWEGCENSGLAGALGCGTWVAGVTVVSSAFPSAVGHCGALAETGVMKAVTIRTNIPGRS